MRPRLPVPWLLALSSALILAAAPAQYLGRQHDDILFVLASHALAAGRYVLLTSPDQPPLVHVWPGLPALLLPVTWLAGDWTPAYQYFLAGILAACPWAIWLWLRRRAAEETALLAALVFATSPLVLSQSGCVMPEAPYALFSVLLLAALSASRPPSSASDCAVPRASPDGGRLRAASASARGARALGSLLFAAVMLRPAGLSLAPASAARPLLERRWADAARRLAPAAAGCLLWLGWCYGQAGFVQEGREWLASYEGRGAAGLLVLPLSNARFFLSSLGGSFLPAALEGGVVALAAGAALAALAAAGLWRVLSREPDDPAGLALATAAAMHLFWGWQYERYWIPLLPLLLWAAAEASRTRAPAVLGAVLAAQLVFRTPGFLRASPHAVPELAPTYSWLRERLGPGDAVASPLYARDGYYARAPAVPLAPAPSAEALARLLASRRVRYVVWQDLDLGLSSAGSSSVARMLAGVREQLSDARHFRAVRSQGEEAVVFEVLRLRANDKKGAPKSH